MPIAVCSLLGVFDACTASHREWDDGGIDAPAEKRIFRLSRVKTTGLLTDTANPRRLVRIKEKYTAL
jgi:hypothetical protein